MTKKSIAILVLLVILIGVVTFEQVYTDMAISTMLDEVSVLQKSLADESLDASKEQAQKIIKIWEQKESVICLFVDYRDISEIGKQTDLILSHLNNADFELAKVECNYLKRAIETFDNMVSFDWQNIM